MHFQDRTDAGRLLAVALAAYAHRPDVIVLALPRGGVPVAAEVALALGAPLDVFLAHKIGAPHDPELAIGAVAETGAPYYDEATVRGLNIPFSHVREAAGIQQAEIARKAARYRGVRPSPGVAGRCAILVDDGIATGSTAHAALLALRAQEPARLILAAPVAAAESIQRLAMDADELAVLHCPAGFAAVGEYYRVFKQVSDDEVVALLAAAAV